MRYVSCGHVMLNQTEIRQGEPGEPKMGGPALFALSGMRIWTEECTLACRAGTDFDLYFRAWMDKHGISRNSVDIEADHSIRNILVRRGHTVRHHRTVYGEEHKGFLRITAEHIDRATDYETMGIYLMQNTDLCFWRKLYDIKTRKGFKVMWELENPQDRGAFPYEMKFVKEILPRTDLWSVSLAEASHLFKIPQRSEEEIIAEIMNLPLEMTLLRLGNEGSWVITPSTAAHCDTIELPETIDALGCGSAAAGAALVAYCEGYNAARVSVMANISAGFSAARGGVIDPITGETLRRAQQLAQEWYGKVTLRKRA